ncbi:MAG: hypothetical protein IJX47_00500 [Clostridia bacterium]|nr:hypothetical protein [Clostridia bacterium]
MVLTTLIETLVNNDNSSLLRYSLYRSICEGRDSFSISICNDHSECVCAEDITDDLSAAMRFLRLLHREGAEPCHLHYILEDMLPLK